jgi:hypothetical protein
VREDAKLVTTFLSMENVTDVVGELGSFAHGGDFEVTMKFDRHVTMKFDC